MASDFNFGLDGLTESLDSQTKLTADRQAAQLEQQQRQQAMTGELARIAKRSAEVSQGLMVDLGPAMATLDRVEKGRQEQEQLRASGNPGDFLSYIGNQIMEPGVYTQAGRAKTSAEVNQIVNAKTQQAALAQGAMQDLMQVVKADYDASGGQLAMAALLETQGNERIQAEVTRTQTLAQSLVANRALAEQRLAIMSADETRALVAKAGGKPIDVGGVMIDPGTMEARIQALDDRALAMESTELARAANKQELVRKMSRKELETMNLEELRPLLSSGSERFAIEDIQDVYNIKNAALTEEMTRTRQMLTYQDIGNTLFVPVIQDIERMDRVIPKNSPLGNSVNGFRTVVSGTLGMLDSYRQAGKPIPPEVAAAASEVIRAGREDIDKAVAAEAKLKSKGDKNLLDAYTEFYRGNPVPRASVESAITERLESNLPLDDIFLPETAKAVRDAYNTRYQTLKKENALNPLGGVADKDLKAQAMREAIDQGVKETVTGRTQEFFQAQVSMPGHPLAGQVDANQMIGLVAEADQRGIQTFKQNYGLDDEEMARFLAGETIPGKVTAADAANLTVIQTQELLLRLDAYGPGLGKKYADWWTKNGNDYLLKLQQERTSKAGAVGIQGAAVDSFASPMELEQGSAYMQLLSAAADGLDSAKEKRFNDMVSFDFQPENRQAALLQFDDSLTDSERSTFMRGFLLPLIKEGQDKGLEYDEVNKIIEQAIDANVAPDPEVAKILKKVAKNRVKIIENVESTMTNPFWRYARKAAPGGAKLNELLGGGQGPYGNQGARGYQWYKDALESQ